MKAKQLTTMAMFVALSVVGRVYLSFIPNFQPTTAIIIIVSLVLGPAKAVLVALSSVFLSNAILGMGIWTIWQMAAWSVIGLVSGIIGLFHMKVNIYILSGYAGFCGYLYGFIISIPASQFVGNFWGYYLAGLPFDTSHAVGNVMFFFVFYPILMKLFNQFQIPALFGRSAVIRID